MSRAGLTAASMLFTIYISATEVSAAGCYVKSLAQCDCTIEQTGCGALSQADKWTERCLCPTTDKTYGKDIFYDKINEHDLLTKCTHDYCLDRKESRGSCYYFRQDIPQLANSVICDVTEEQCCGSIGCSSQNGGRLANHSGYYWYAAGYVSRGTCCHCMASCDRTKEPTTVAGNNCTYYDVTSSWCERSEHDSISLDRIGRKKCAVPADKTVEDMVIRYPPPPSSGASSLKTGSRSFALLATVGTFVMQTSNKQSLLLYALCAVFMFANNAYPSLAAHIPELQGVAAEMPSDASIARYLVHANDYAVVATYSVHHEGNIFSNVMSYSDGIGMENSTGRLFFYMTLMDPTGAALKKNSAASVTISQAQLAGAPTVCGEIDNGVSTCAKLTIMGDIEEVTDVRQRDYALKALLSRNPEMAGWPSEHGWVVLEMKPTHILLQQNHEGTTRVPVSAYFLAIPAKGLPRRRGYLSPLESALKKHKLRGKSSVQIRGSKLVATGAKSAATKAQAARKLVHDASWGVLATTSAEFERPIGHVESFTDGGFDHSTGKIWFFLSEKDLALEDVRVNSQVSFTISQAMVDAYDASVDNSCHGAIAEDPTCARITLSGHLAPLISPTTSAVDEANGELLPRHMVVKMSPTSRDIHVYELIISEIFFINFYGGAEPMSVADYFAAWPSLNDGPAGSFTTSLSSRFDVKNDYENDA